MNVVMTNAFEKELEGNGTPPNGPERKGRGDLLFLFIS